MNINIVADGKECSCYWNSFVEGLGVCGCGLEAGGLVIYSSAGARLFALHLDDNTRVSVSLLYHSGRESSERKPQVCRKLTAFDERKISRKCFDAVLVLIY